MKLESPRGSLRVKSNSQGRCVFNLMQGIGGQSRGNADLGTYKQDLMVYNWRTFVYSYLDIQTLVQVIGLLSQQERQHLQCKQASEEKEYFSDEHISRCLTLNFSKLNLQSKVQLTPDHIDFLCSIACQADIEVQSMTDQTSFFVVQTVLSKLEGVETILKITVNKDIQ